ncbi:MAG: glycosyltransferase family 4 protein [Pseudomonadota bacterium]
MMITLPLSAAIVCLAFVSSLLMTAIVHRYALRALLDVPNERSSHVRPTPRGGGLAIGLVFLSAVGLLATFDILPASLSAALIGGGLLVAGVGWLDDHRPVAARWRILVHFAAALWAVFCLGGFPSISLGQITLPLGWLGHVLAVIGVVWLINLYNFMDGIDGLAAGEAVTVALAAAGLLWLSGAVELALVAAVFAAACGGFLWWNWQPAKIFMGDAGSGLLGYCFAVLALASEKAAAVPVVIWMILLAVFVLDATFTLLSRVIGGEKWYNAHRMHAYQRLTQLGFSHARVTSGVLLVNLLLLAPIAWFLVRQPIWTGLIVPGVVLLGWFVWKAVQHRFGKTQS